MEKDIEVIFLGEENLGKTQIRNQLVSGKFDGDHYRIYSPQENRAIIKIKEDNIIKSKNLVIYNIIGTKKFNSIINNFLRTANIALLVYEITNIESFIGLYNWNELLMEKKFVKMYNCK